MLEITKSILAQKIFLLLLISAKSVLALTAQGRIMQGEGTRAGHTWLLVPKIMRILLIHSSCALTHKEISFPLIPFVNVLLIRITLV